MNKLSGEPFGRFTRLAIVDDHVPTGRRKSAGKDGADAFGTTGNKNGRTDHAIV